MKKTKCGKYEKLNEKIYEWFKCARSKNVPISGSLIKEKALKLADQFNLHGKFGEILHGQKKLQGK